MRRGTVFTVIGADPVRAMRCVLDVHGGLVVNDPKGSTCRCEQSSGTGTAREVLPINIPCLVRRYSPRVASIYECDDQRCLFQCINQFIRLAQAPAIAVQPGENHSLTIYRGWPKGGSCRESRNMANQRTDLLQGTLDMLILKALQLGPMHGFGISVLIRQMSKEVLQVEQGSLYPALYRLEEQGWISSEWGTSENNRKAKFYKLTPAGRKQLLEETSNWERLSTAINLILKTT